MSVVDLNQFHSQRARVMAKRKLAAVGEFTYSVPVLEVYGNYPVPVAGTIYPCYVALVATEDALLDPDNLRIDNPNVKGNDSKAGQKRLKDYLNGVSEDSKMANDANKLTAALAFNGGLSEPLSIQGVGGKTYVREGNRRFASLTESGDETFLALVLPDQMPLKDVKKLIDPKHLSGPLEWSSYVTSKRVYEMYKDEAMSLEDIAKHCQFGAGQSGINQAQKYIDAYVWYKLSKCEDTSDWSKFHHAVSSPTLRRHFGYNPATQQFEPNSRQPVKDDAKTAKEVDDHFGMKTDFEWFCGLIHDGKLTDCRQSDGLVAPLIRESDKPYSKRVFELLNAKPARKTKDGKKEESPAAVAERYLKESRQENHLTKKTDSLIRDFKTVIDSIARLKEYSEDTEENSELRLSLQKLQLTAKKLHDSTLPKRGRTAD